MDADDLAISLAHALTNTVRDALRNRPGGLKTGHQAIALTFANLMANASLPDDRRDMAKRMVDLMPDLIELADDLAKQRAGSLTGPGT